MYSPGQNAYYKSEKIILSSFYMLQYSVVCNVRKPYHPVYSAELVLFFAFFKGAKKSARWHGAWDTCDRVRCVDRGDFFLHHPPLWSLKPHPCLILAFACPKIEKKLFCRLIPVKSSWCSLTSDYVCTSQTKQLRNETLNKLSSKVTSSASY